LTNVRYAPPNLQRKPQLCRPFLAILFSELILAPLEFRKFLPSRFEPVWRSLNAFRHGLPCLLNAQPMAKLEPQKGSGP
jgi:hypothetical protein